MTEHSLPSIMELRRTADGNGGKMLSVSGDRAPFYAGLRRAPAATLLEALLTFMAKLSYKQIVVFSAAGPHLPEIDLGGNMVVGLTPAIWLFRGDTNQNPGYSPISPPKNAIRPGEIVICDILADYGTAAHAKVLQTAQEMTWAERIEVLLLEVEQRCGWNWDGARRSRMPLTTGVRTLAIVDEAWIYPGDGRIEEARVPEQNRRNSIEKRFCALGDVVANSALDLLLLTTCTTRAEALQAGHLLDIPQQANSRFPSAVPQHEVPSLKWDRLASIEMPSVDPRTPWGHWLSVTQSAGSLYSSLRSTPVTPAEGARSDNPWSSSRMRQILREAPDALSLRVKGQPAAIEAVCSVLETAAAGLTPPGRPRGVLLFAGPTGVGKTELAKALSGLVFGNERAFKYLEMGQFNDHHTVSRLFGPPPEYQGAERGGELTGFVKRNPFSLVLFDEIEKAHPDIYKTLLSVIDDGRMTEASTGDLVLFSNCVLIFTSNLGASNVRESQSFDQVRNIIREHIRQYFYSTVGMPEFLGRIGYPDDVVVFDFIRPNIAVGIFEMLVRNQLAEVSRSRGVSLSIAEDAHQAMLRECTRHLDLGGRGIKRQVESSLNKPLARALTTTDLGGGEWRIVNWRRESHGCRLDLEPGGVE